MTENIYQQYAESAHRSEANDALSDVEVAPWAAPVAGPPPPPQTNRVKRDACAVGSAICGLTGFIPIVTQVIGLVLGLLAIGRIRRARLLGQERGGMRHAVAGLITNGTTLLIWVAVLAAASTVFRSFASTAGQLSKLFPAP